MARPTNAPRSRHISPWRGKPVLWVGLVALLSASFGPAIIRPASAAASPQNAETGAPAGQSGVFEGWQQPASSMRKGIPKPTTKLGVVLALSLHDGGLPSLVQSVSDPTSSGYRHYESVSWLASHTGATAATVDDVLAYLRSQGIQGHLDPTASYVRVVISIRQASKLFDTTYRSYRLVHAGGTENLVAPDSAPRLPSQLVGNVPLVLGTSALLSYTLELPPPLEQKATERSAFSSTFGTMGTPGGCPAGDHVTGRSGKLLTPMQYLTAYGVEGLHAQGVSGRGQSVAVLSLSTGRQSDLATFTHCFGLATPHLQNIHVGGGSQPALASSQVHDEVSLDTEMVAAMAPQLSDIDVIHTTNDSATGLLELFDAPLDRSLFHGPMPRVVTFSGGICEVGGNEPYSQFPLAYALYEHLFVDTAANGVSVVAASGDWGSSCNLFNASNRSGFGDRSLAQLSVQYPASSPYVTGAGGALFGLDANDSIKNEETWNDLPLGVGLAGGGGESTAFSRPWYQAGLTLNGSGRLVPDVSLEADTSYPIATYCSSGCQSVGWQPGSGTSAAAPLLAGGIALANEVALSQHYGSLGLINPLLYQLGQTRSSALRDITRGNNDVYGLGCCAAGPGYDEASGWGSVNFSQLIGAADAVAARS